LDLSITILLLHQSKGCATIVLLIFLMYFNGLSYLALNHTHQEGARHFILTHYRA